MSFDPVQMVMLPCSCVLMCTHVIDLSVYRVIQQHRSYTTRPKKSGASAMKGSSKKDLASTADVEQGLDFPT